MRFSEARRTISLCASLSLPYSSPQTQPSPPVGHRPRLPLELPALTRSPSGAPSRCDQPDSVVSLQISGDTARVEISQPMFFVVVRLRGDWIRRSVPLYDGPAPGAFVDGPPLVPDTATRRGSQSITTMPIYPGDTRAQ